MEQYELLNFRRDTLTIQLRLVLLNLLHLVLLQLLNIFSLHRLFREVVLHGVLRIVLSGIKFSEIKI